MGTIQTFVYVSEHAIFFFGGNGLTLTESLSEEGEKEREEKYKNKE